MIFGRSKTEWLDSKKRKARVEESVAVFKYLAIFDNRHSGTRRSSCSRPSGTRNLYDAFNEVVDRVSYLVSQRRRRDRRMGTVNGASKRISTTVTPCS